MTTITSPAVLANHSKYPFAETINQSEKYIPNAADN